MKIGKFNEKISEALCNAALKIAHKTVEIDGDIPICTIIIHQPKVPEKLKQSQCVRKRDNYENCDL